VEGPLDGKIKGPGDLLCESEIDQLRARWSKAPVGRSWLVLDQDDLRCFIFANLSRSCHEDVVWLDIEMDIALGMDVFQSPADLHDNIEKLLLLEGRRSSPRMNSLTMNQSWLSETLPKSCTRARFGWRNLVSASYSTLDHSSESSTRSDRSNLSATLRRTWRMSSHRNTVPIAPAPSCRSTRYLPLMHSPALKEPMMTPGTGLQGATDDTYRSWIRIRRNRRCRRCPATTDQRNRGLRRPMGEEEHLNGG